LKRVTTKTRRHEEGKGAPETAGRDRRLDPEPTGNRTLPIPCCPGSPRILLLHKPKGVEVTRPHSLDREAYPGQKTVYHVLPSEFHEQGWVPVGRLDKDSTGLLLFVREGFLVGRLQKPGALDKVYEVWVRGRVLPEHVEQALKGVSTPIGPLRAKAVTLKGGAGPKSRVEVVLDEGKNRHIRRLFAAMKDPVKNKVLKVTDLKRLRFGPVELDVPSGEWRFLNPEETDNLLSCFPRKKSVT